MTLAGASVKVNGEPAQVLYASPEQINFLMPEGTPLGAARITLENLGRDRERVFDYEWLKMLPPSAAQFKAAYERGEALEPIGAEPEESLEV